jgi:hypothetical protein
MSRSGRIAAISGMDPIERQAVIDEIERHGLNAIAHPAGYVLAVAGCRQNHPEFTGCFEEVSRLHSLPGARAWLGY